MIAGLVSLILSFQGVANACQDGPVWRLTPETRIGSEDSEEYALTRIGALAIAADGSIVVSDRGDRRLRVFERSGQFVRWIGGTGQGPGEFEYSVNHISLRSDTVEVLEGRRLHLFLRSGELLRTTPVQYDLGVSYRSGPLAARTSTGDLLSFAAIAADAYLSGRVSGMPLVRVDESGTVVNTITTEHLSDETVVVSLPGGRQTLATRFHSRTFAIAPDGDRIVFVSQSVPEAWDPDPIAVTVVGLEGDTLLRRHVQYRPVRIPEAARDSIAAALVRSPQPGLPLPPAERRAIREQAAVPEYYPAVQDVLFGSDGRIWLRRYVQLGTEWCVLDSMGKFEGVVRGGGSLRIHAATASHVWATELDSLDVPTLLHMRIAVPDNERRPGNEGTIR